MCSHFEDEKLRFRQGRPSVPQQERALGTPRNGCPGRLEARILPMGLSPPV